MCWRGYLSGAKCRLAYGPADTTATHCLLFLYFRKIRTGFTFLVPAHPGSPGQRVVKRLHTHKPGRISCRPTNSVKALKAFQDRCTCTWKQFLNTGALVMMMTMISRLATIYSVDVFCKGLEVSSWQTKHSVAADSRITDPQRAVNTGLFTVCRRQAQDCCTWRQFGKTDTLPARAWSRR